MNLTIMTDEKRKLIDWLNRGITECKVEKECLLESLRDIQKTIDEKVAIMNELMGMPIK